VVFGAGRLSDQKGFDILIHAADLLKEKCKDLVFVVAGKGREGDKLKNLVSKHNLKNVIHFIGFVEDIHPYLQGCDLFVLSSLFEGMPNVVMEAMAEGKAVAATDVNGVRELMVHKKTGIIIPPRDPQALADAIHDLINDPEQLRKFGKAGLERVRSHFTLEKMIRNLETYFQEKLAEKGHDYQIS
jgi:glycosyltransferase involved in cell wall biosynthesis